MANEKRLIDANRAINEMQSVLDEHPDQKDTVAYHAFSSIIDCLKREPTVDAVEVVHGRWILREDGYHCSSCDIQAIYTGVELKYCPNCGADMRGDSK